MPPSEANKEATFLRKGGGKFRWRRYVDASRRSPDSPLTYQHSSFFGLAKPSAVRSDFSQNQIDHEGKRKPDKPGIVVQLDERAGNRCWSNRFYGDKKAWQVWQNRQHKCHDSYDTDPVCIPIFPQPIVKRSNIELPASNNEIIRNHDPADRPE